MEQLSLQTLYKKTATGADQFWTIRTEDNVIVTRWGQVGGKEQETRDTIKEGKNEGRSNATTAIQQAHAEAEAQWEKKLKKGYVKGLDDARAGKRDKLIEGGIDVMLAQSFDKHSAKIHYPCLVSPKLDGIRCIAVIKGGTASLWSRTRKPIRSMPHIVEALEICFGDDDAVLDGELYHPDYKDDFNKIISLVRPDAPVDGHEVVQYHIFDIVRNEPFGDRYRGLKECIETVNALNLNGPLKLVEQKETLNQDAVLDAAQQFMSQGYEGAMAKNIDSPYENKRSYHLQKVKFMQDAEFRIIGMEEGRGKLAGHVGAFVCETMGGLQFRAKLKGSLEHLRHLFDHTEEWIDCKLTVQYQNLTPDGLPRFPVGVAIRNYE